MATLYATGRRADFDFSCEGSIWLVRPLNNEAEEHLRDNVEPDARWFGPSLVVEQGYVNDLAYALRREGFTIGGR